MDDHDYPPEVLIDYFRCVEKPHIPLTNFDPTPPCTSAPLLVISSRFGYLVRAVRSVLYLDPLAHLRRDTPSDSQPSVDSIKVDLAPHGVTTILGISLLRNDTALLLHAEGRRAGVFLTSLPALVEGQMAWMAGVKLNPEIAIRSIAVGGESTVAVIQEGGAVTLCELNLGEEIDGAYIDGLGEGGGLCVGISPGGELVAVGVDCGSLYLYDAASLDRKGEIVVVESGWVPFAVSFITEEDLLVAYVKDALYSYIVWTIAEDHGREGALLPKTRSMLGELCYPALSLPPSEDEGEANNKTTQNDAPNPVVFCCPIPSWPVCVVSSSCSSDIEVIARKEDSDGWEIWKFDEGKSAVLPMGEDDTDSKPLAIGLDLTDTVAIDPIDPSAPKISPMPRLIALTTESLLIPFALIDDRNGARCDAVKKPQPLPLVPTFSRPVESVNFKRDIPKVESSSTAAENESRGSVIPEDFTGSFATGENKGSESLPALGFKAESVSSFGKVGRQPGFAGVDTAGTWWAVQSRTVPDVANVSFGSQVRTQWNGMASSDEESDDDVKDSDKEESRLSSSAAATDVEDGTERGSIQSANVETSIRANDLGFSGTEKFLSKFEFVGISNERQLTEESKPLLSASRPPASGSRGASRHRREEGSASSSLAAITLPAYPLQPSFEDVSAAVSSGKPEDLIRSVLLEMKQELDYNREAQVVMMKRTQAVGEAIMPRVDAAKDKLSAILQDIREYFRRETALRRDVSDSLSAVTSRSKEFETICLEFRIREEEGFSRDIQPEDKLIDEQISKKEVALTNSIAEIESRLQSEKMSRDRPISQVEKIQRIYSSLSLQGIRIRRVCGLLATLAARVNELESSGRRSDLGLSVARLEKLSRSKILRSAKGNPSSLASSPVEPRSVTRARTPGLRKNLDNSLSVPDPAEREFPASKEVLSVLRRLAMRGGRANIEAKSSKRLFERNNSDAPSKLLTSDAEMGNKNRGSNLDHGNEEEHGVSRATVSSTQLGTFATARGLQYVGYNDSTPLQRKASLAPTKQTPSQPEEDSVASITNQAAAEPFQSQDKTSAFTANTVFTFTSERDNHTVSREAVVESNRTGAETPKHVQDVYSESLRSGLEFRESSGTTRSPKEIPDEASTALPSSQSTSTGLFASPGYDSPQLKSQAPSKPRTVEPIDQKAPLPPDVSEVTSVAGRGPRDGESARGPTATLPPDDYEKNAVLPPDDIEKKNLYAPLPPDDDVKKCLEASLPPKLREEAYPVTSSPSQSARVGGAGRVTIPSDLKDRSPAEGSPRDGSSARSSPSNSHRGSQSMAGSFAALPPDEFDNKDLLASFSQRSSIQDKHEGPLESAGREGGPGSAIDPIRSSLQSSSQPLVSGKGDGEQLSSIGTNAFGKDSNGSNLPASEKAGYIPTSESTAKTVSQFDGSMPGGALGSQSQKEIRTATSITERDGSSSDDSNVARKSEDRGVFGMDTSMMQSEAGKGFQIVAAQSTSSGQSESMSIFGTDRAQVGLSGFGQTATGSISSTSIIPFGGSQAAQSSQGIFGTGNSSSSGGFGFSGTSTSALGNSGEGFGANFGSSSQFGQPSPIGGGNAFGASVPSSGSAQFGVNSTFGGTNHFGGSQFGAGFGETSQLGAGSPFNALGGDGSSGFGSITPFGSNTTSFGSNTTAFGKGMSSATFGEVSGFGASQSGQGSYGGSNAFGSAGASPFGAVTGSGFGGQSGGGSGFAALASSQGFGGSSGSAFGNSSVPVFGNDNRPPAFTSAAFSERRA